MIQKYNRHKQQNNWCGDSGIAAYVDDPFNHDSNAGHLGNQVHVDLTGTGLDIPLTDILQNIV